MDGPHITLGGQRIEIAPIPLGKLRKLIPAFAKAGFALAAGTADEAAFDDIMQILSMGTGKSAEELEAMPATFPEIIEAVGVIAGVCGLAPKEGDPGNAVAGTDSTGTTSTPTS